MTDEEKIYKILARGLLDIRVSSYERGASEVFNLADLIHNVPYQLERARRGETTHTKIIEWLFMRANQKGMTDWLEIASNAP